MVSRSGRAIVVVLVLVLLSAIGIGIAFHSARYKGPVVPRINGDAEIRNLIEDRVRVLNQSGRSISLDLPDDSIFAEIWSIYVEIREKHVANIEPYDANQEWQLDDFPRAADWIRQSKPVRSFDRDMSDDLVSAGYLDLIDDVVKQPARMRSPDPDLGVAGWINTLTPIGDATRWTYMYLTYRLAVAWVAASKDVSDYHLQTLYTEVDRMLALAEAHTLEPDSTDFMLGVIIESDVNKRIREWVIARPLGRDVHRQIAAKLQSYAVLDVGFAFEGNSVIAAALIDSRMNDGWRERYSRSSARTRVADVYSRAQQAIMLDPINASDELIQLDAEMIQIVDSYAAELDDLVSVFEGMWASNLLACARRAGTLTVLGIEAYRNDTGRLPSTLAELVPEYLDAIPTTPTDPDGLIYRIATAEDVAEDNQRPTDGVALSDTGYVLYSRGIDSEDNGGKFNPTHYMSMYRRGIGLDYIIVPIVDP